MKSLGVAILVLKELYRRKDAYVLFILTALLTLMLASINVFHQESVVRYVKELCLLLIWASSFAIAFPLTARQIPSEREQRTILPLLAKPISRGEFLVGKFIGCWAACGLVLIVFYAFLTLMSAWREHPIPVLSYVEAGWLHWWMLAIVIAVVLLGSVVFTASSSNITISLLVVVGQLAFGPYLHRIALGLAEPAQTIVTGLYYLLPHFEFFDLRAMVTHNWGAIPVHVLMAATAYAAFYTTIFLIAAWLRFRRQPLMK